MNHLNSDPTQIQLSQLPRSLIASRCTRMHDARQLPPYLTMKLMFALVSWAELEMTLKYPSHTLPLQGVTRVFRWA
jgi:hypothetical protein